MTPDAGPAVFRKGLQPGAGVLMGAREDQPRDAERGRPRQPAKRRPSTPSPSRHRVGAHISGWDSLVRDAHRHATAKGSPEISDVRTKSALFPGPSAGGISES